MAAQLKSILSIHVEALLGLRRDEIQKPILQEH